jgi:transposase-like protein
LPYGKDKNKQKGQKKIEQYAASATPGEGVALLAREVGQHATLLFSLDRLLHEMVTASRKQRSDKQNEHLTLAPRRLHPQARSHDGTLFFFFFLRYIIWTQAEQYGLTTKSYAGLHAAFLS